MKLGAEYRLDSGTSIFRSVFGLRLTGTPMTLAMSQLVEAERRQPPEREVYESVSEKAHEEGATASGRRMQVHMCSSVSEYLYRATNLTSS